MPTTTLGSITIRRSDHRDSDALRRLATLDSAATPTGGSLVAEHDGALVAAISLDGRAAIADPFKPTAAIVSLLRSWSRQVQHAY